MLKQVGSGDAFCDCGCCCYYLCQICQLCNDKVEKEDDDFTAKDNVFYFAMYVFVMTDFYCRTFPLLAYTVLLHKYLSSLTNFDLLNVFIGVAPAAFIILTFELLMYYMMLKKKDKTFKGALKYFWTGTFTISYYLLSTMHLTYLPSNVRFVRMYRAHFFRMLLQVIIMSIGIGMQYTLFDDPLGFFNRSVYFFAFNWILNIIILLVMKCYMVTFESKIAMTLSSKH